MEIRLKDKYNKIIKELASDIKEDNVMALPRITKVVINSGVGKIKDDKNLVASIEKDITLIAGQKPMRRAAKKSISNFKVRQGDVVGISVTLRGERMWFFLDKLISVALPRVRDFRGVSKKSFDGHGNYSLGIKEHTVFPEINPNTVDKIKSFEVSIVTSSDSDEAALQLLTKLGMPFEK
jgi:large subunit ribosomal protein L5